MKINEILDNYIAPALPATLDTVSSICVEGAASAIIPGVGNMLIAYKQKQQEKRFERAIAEIQKRQEEIDEILKAYQNDTMPKIERLLELYLDYSIENTQEKKIKLLANGYVNSIKIENPQEDILLGFYDMLLQVNMLDIRVLKLYEHKTLSEQRDSYGKVMQDYHIDYSQYNMVRAKLARLGLLESRNDIKQEENINLIIEYIQATVRNKENDAKQASKKMKKGSKQDNYVMTSYGSNFLKFIAKE